MNIKELKKEIENLPDDMLVGGAGHFGEFLEVWDMHIRKVHAEHPISRKHNKEITIFGIDIEDAGPEPD